MLESMPGGAVMAKYPKLFCLALLPRHPMSQGLTCSEHWWPIVDRACAILADIPGLQMQQVKQKLGRLRMYCDATETMSIEHQQVLGQVMESAVRQSETTCESCGAPGSSFNLHGWMGVLCPWHQVVHLRKSVRNLRNALFDRGLTTEQIIQIEEADDA